MKSDVAGWFEFTFYRQKEWQSACHRFTRDVNTFMISNRLESGANLRGLIVAVKLTLF
jgi:hypothetical protein